MHEPKEIFVNMSKCTACKTCVISCAVEHSKSKNLYGALMEKPTPKPRLYVEWVSPETNVPIVCRHCEDAPYAFISIRENNPFLVPAYCPANAGVHAGCVLAVTAYNRNVCLR